MALDKILVERLSEVRRQYEGQFFSLFQHHLSLYWNTETGLDITAVRSWLVFCPPDTDNKSLSYRISRNYGAGAGQFVFGIYHECLDIIYNRAKEM